MIADVPKISAIAPWFGSKRNLAAEIVRELGPHRIYWEPFCGSLAVLLNKPTCVMETVNDLNGDVINLARVVADSRLGPQLYRRLRRTLMSEVFHREAAERYKARKYGGDGAADLDAAYDYFLCAWLGRNGVAGTESYNQGFCVRYTGNGGHAATRWASVVDSIPAWRRRLRNVMILCRDGFDVLSKIDDDERVVIYLDPPYLEKGARYIHDFVDHDHARLAALAGRFTRARVVVSYYDHPMIDDLYCGWTKRVFEISKSLVNQGLRARGGGEKVKAREALFINGPSLGATRNGQLF